MLRKIGVLLAALVALLALTVAGANAQSAVSGNEDPQTTNIPYVGWVGTQLRLSKCLAIRDDDHEADVRQELSLGSLALRGKFTIEAWSGDNTTVVNSPFFTNADNDRTSGDVAPVIEQYGRGEEGRARLCFSVHLTSYSPGLAVVKLTLRDDILGLFPGAEPYLKHQFLAIFMTATAPTLTEEAGGGDPDGSGTYRPQGVAPNRKFNPGLVKTSVKGTFPHGSLGPVFPAGAASYTLPDDWAALANLWATDNDPYNGGVYGSAPNRWDIHDDTALRPEEHTSNACATPLAAIDIVDNCLGGGDTGRFSRDNTGNPNAAGLEMTNPTIGPFDPLRPRTSFLPDGKLDSGDAPMPALRVDLNTTGTIGQLIKADKSAVYSKDGLGSSTAHNLYAPFYQAYIPAVSGPGTSGVAGTAGNNFPGFQTDGPYDYWDTLLEEEYSNPNNTCRNPLGQIYIGSSGVSGVTLYTDEHGEAWAMYDPKINNLTGGFDIAETVFGSNIKCDLSPGVAGVETISAVGKYPEQPALAIAFPNTLTKTVLHEASKTLTCAPKTGFDGIVCTETITDLAGNPIAGAAVRFSVVSEAGGGAQVLQSDMPGQEGTLDQRGLTLVTDRTGRVEAFISDSFNNCLDIRTENLGTRVTLDNSSVGVTRTVKYTGITGVVCGTAPAPPPAGGGGTGGNNNTGGNTNTGGTTTTSSGGSTSAGSSVVVNLGTPVIKANPVLDVSTTKQAIVASNSARLFSVKVLQSKLGRYLVVNVKGKAKMAKVRIVFVGKNGKALKAVTRVVPTNRVFKIANLKLPKTAVSVRASVISA